MKLHVTRCVEKQCAPVNLSKSKHLGFLFVLFLKVGEYQQGNMENLDTKCRVIVNFQDLKHISKTNLDTKRSSSPKHRSRTK